MTDIMEFRYQLQDILDESPTEYQKGHELSYHLSTAMGQDGDIGMKLLVDGNEVCISSVSLGLEKYYDEYIDMEFPELETPEFQRMMEQAENKWGITEMHRRSRMAEYQGKVSRPQKKLTRKWQELFSAVDSQLEWNLSAKRTIFALPSYRELAQDNAPPIHALVSNYDHIASKMGFRLCEDIQIYKHKGAFSRQ